jgi:hypothetical protein
MKSTVRGGGIYESLHRSWKYLIGVAVVPPFMAIGHVLGIPFVVLAVPMFVAAGIAMWPWLSGREPFSFWGAACCVWLASGAVTAIGAWIINVIAV